LVGYIQNTKCIGIDKVWHVCRNGLLQYSGCWCIVAHKELINNEQYFTFVHQSTISDIEIVWPCSKWENS